MKNGFRYDEFKKVYYIEKTPGSLLDYGHDWTDFLAKTPGDTIESSDWSISPSGQLSVLTKAIQGNKTTVWLEGGLVGHSYDVTNVMTTVNDRKPERTFQVRMVAKLSG